MNHTALLSLLSLLSMSSRTLIRILKRRSQRAIYPPCVPTTNHVFSGPRATVVMRPNDASILRTKASLLARRSHAWMYPDWVAYINTCWIIVVKLANATTGSLPSDEGPDTPTVRLPWSNRNKCTLPSSDADATVCVLSHISVLRIRPPCAEYVRLDCTTASRPSACVDHTW